MIVDGTSQAEYFVPRFAQPSKATSNAPKLKTHFVGAIVHGIGSWLYGMLDNWKHDSNLTIEVIQRTLQKVELTGRELPPRLDLQFDNCFRENKNRYRHCCSVTFNRTKSSFLFFGRYVLTYLSMLVERAVFQEVYVWFLPKGHTHEDIDALFGRVSMHVRERNALSLEELGNLMTGAGDGHVLRFEEVNEVCLLRCLSCCCLFVSTHPIEPLRYL